MDHCKLAACRKMRMGVAVVRFAMRGPTGMTDADDSMKIFTRKEILQVGNFSFLFINFQPAIEQSNTGTVIAAVLKAFQSFQNNRIRFTRSDISNNSTHK